MERVRTEEDSMLSEVDPVPEGRRSLKLWVGVLTASVGAAVIGVSMIASRPLSKAEVRASIEEEEMVVQNAKQFCSKTEEDCAASKCCAVSGFMCFEKTPGVHRCMEECDPHKGWTCRMPHEITPLVEATQHSNWLNPQLYCWAVYTENTGADKQEHELELLQQQFARKVSMFACESNDVFSDVVVEIGAGYPTIKLDDVDNEFHLIKRKEGRGWVNTGMFKQAWKAIGLREGPKRADWIIKVDADAVFVPQRLKKMLLGHPLSAAGIYFENCKEVEWGLFGNLEVWSIQAFNALLLNLDSCSQSIDWVTGTKWGPIGEDLFAQMCMDKQGVSKVQNWDLTTDGACPGTLKRWGEKKNKHWKVPCDKVRTPSLHPFKKPQEYFSCMDATLALER